MYNYVIFIQSMSKNNFVLGYLYFSAPGPGPGTQLRPPICIYRPWPPICVYRPWSKFLFTGLGQFEAWACRYQPCPPNLYLLALVYDFYYRALNLHLPSYL